ncbi:hypothetical protein QV05_07615 [Gallibacterium genomosp. 1]|uniref:DUF2570 domain-containing protein n=1 Tax=Gallibacterium genomosp. 1 TaxID=155515 RepID=A0AB36DVD5_9PAST|nr:DUF2570 family protein [Gallibacterium genomosp. 1]OBX00449.1 hypothetical protein QV05_07615 [Gallibacterium genomosp. 1]
MFNQFKTWLNIAALCLILGLCGWVWYQSQMISSLKAKNQMQAQTITTQSQTIADLKAEAKRNYQLTQDITTSESKIREQSDNVIRTIQTQVKNVDAHNAAAPRNVIEFLQQSD